MKYSADTSFIIGLFVNEPRSQSVRDTYKKLKSNKEKVFVPAQTIVEVIYVLEKFYKLDRELVAEYVLSILDTYIFMVEKYNLFYKAIKLYATLPPINIGDIIIAEESKNQKIDTILSFDSHFKKLGLKVVS